MKNSIVVVGSSNTDMVVIADHLPAPGETILARKFLMNPGGKGANQAVAAARLGGNVIFIARTGADIFGSRSMELFESEGIQSQFITEDPENPSGIALITVDKNGENSIVVASGCNAALSSEDVMNASESIQSAAVLLLQLEIPLTTVETAIDLAASASVPVILNPAPACLLPASLLSKVFILTPNESEAEMLTGICIQDKKSAEEAAQKLLEMGVKNVIITMGADGALFCNADLSVLIKAPVVKAVDTTAAGDVFNGALAVALAEGKEIMPSIEFACCAASISVTRLGAQASAPCRSELK
ncbi:MAG: ribokinase [Bacteroidetes bacterium]|nr:MAG: ribokinase [Bacteroidota bacterium]